MARISVIKPAVVTRSLVSISLVILLAGCFNVPVKPQELVASGFEVEQRHPYTVFVRVKGQGSATAFFAGDNVNRVTSDTMENAIKQSIESSRVFAALQDESSADYWLEVTIFHVDWKQSGLFTFTSTFRANWRLKDRRTKKTLFQQLIASEADSTDGGAMGGPGKVAVASERAARANIRDGLSALAKLRLQLGM